MRKLFLTSLIPGLIFFGSGPLAEPKPFPEFSAKRIKPPSGASSNRIKIQIDPAATSAPIKAPTNGAAAAPRVGQYDWFWTKVSPDIAHSGPGRLETAMQALSIAASKVSSPRLQDMQAIAKAQGVEILKATIDTQVSPALVLAVMTVESAGNPAAVSKAGAQGLMQLMPATAERFGVVDSMVPSQNITGGVKYLNWLMGEFQNDPILVLAGYNSGEGSVRKHKGVPPFVETRDYVPKVLAAFQVARGLCLTPPELISDGCVFATMK